MSPIKNPRIAPTCFLAMLLAPVVSLADSEIERRVPARPDGLVTISNISGSVTVSGWDRNEVEVTGFLGRGVEEVEIDSSGNVTEIEVELMRRSGHGWGGDARLEIRVPEGSDLDIEVVSAEVEIDGVSGELTVESVSGSIEIEGDAKALDLEAVSGSIEVEASVEQLEVETVSGRIRLRGEAEEIEADTVSGSIDLSTGGVRRADLSTTSGGIDLDGSLAGRAEIEIESHSGSVELNLPSSTSARFRVETYSGRIDNELGPPAKRTGRYTPEKKLEFSLGDGEARIVIDTFSGSVRLRRQ